jgi:hypothetical protein
MMLARRLAASVALVSLLVSPVWAKKNLADWNNVVDLDPDTEVVVTLKNGGVLTGVVSKVLPDALELDITISSPVATRGAVGFERKVDRSEIREIRKRRGSRLASALIGAGIGAGAGMGIAAAGDARSENHEFRGLAMAALGLIGGLIGAGVGANNPRKGKQIYVAP